MLKKWEDLPYFMKNDEIRRHYIENAESLKKVKYQILKPNVFFYKIKREIKRIFKKFKVLY